MINIYYDNNLRIEAKNYQTFPLLHRMEEENSVLTKYYKVVKCLGECDIGIVPMSIQYLILRNKKIEIENFIDDCINAGKKVLLFSGGDYGLSLNNDRIYTIRLGGFHSKLNSSTYIMPPFINDPYEIMVQKFKPLNKSEKPDIGFVGHANGSWIKYIKEYVLFIKGDLYRMFEKDVTDRQHYYPSSIKRYKYLKSLSNSKGIKCNFIFRGKYRAGTKTKEDKETTTKEFYNNMNQNLYTFCLRGAGNFSVRLYETLAMGRIPILIETDCRLPFYKEINWQRHCIIVSEKEIKTLGDKIIEFHQNHIEDELIKIQKENRLIWKDYFTKTTYFLKLADKLKI